ncbi:MAG: polyketide cyclase [Gemmatimonadales bacterium]|nr:MAG: polyketide cyclase [Gemmatimonadales bacterium]
MIRPLHDPELDLVLDRVVDVPPELVWEAWTRAEHLRKWFAPAPWTVADCRIDLRPGGQFYTVMRSPEGEEFPGDGCILEVEEHRRLVFTDALAPGYRPAREAFFTCVLTLEPEGPGTRYVARAMHRNPEDRERHEAMGFQEGWGTCLDQLVKMVKEW